MRWDVLFWNASTGLHRQSELTVKEPFRVIMERRGGKTILDVVGLGGSFVAAEDDAETGDHETGVQPAKVVRLA